MKYRKLKAMSASDADARKVAANRRYRCRNSRMRLNRALPVARLTDLACPDPHALKRLNRSVRTRVPAGVGGGRAGKMSASNPICIR